MNLQEFIPVSIFPNSFITNTNISPSAKILFQILCSYDNDGQNYHKGWVELSVEQLQESVGLTNQQIRNLLKQLTDKGLITVVYRNNRQSVGPRTSIYILNVLPGISEEDRLHIQKNCNLEIKNAVSGLNNIKVKTRNGIEYVSAEEFDLEYLVTGYRSSEIIEGELLEEEVKKSPQVKTTVTVTSSGKKIKQQKVTNMSDDEIAMYFKDQVEQCFGCETKVKGKSNLAIIANLRNEFSVDFILRIIKFYIWNYEKMFSTRDYPRPRLYSLNQDWIVSKIIDNMETDDKKKNVITPVEASIDVEENNENLLEGL